MACARAQESLRTGQDAASSRDLWVAQTGDSAADSWLLKARERHVPFSVWCAVCGIALSSTALNCNGGSSFLACSARAVLNSQHGSRNANCDLPFSICPC